MNRGTLSEIWYDANGLRTENEPLSNAIVTEIWEAACLGEGQDRNLSYRELHTAALQIICDVTRFVDHLMARRRHI